MLSNVDVLYTFENDAVKHLCGSLFFSTTARLRYEGLLECDSYSGVFQWILKKK